MLDINWVSGVIAGAICLGAGILGVMKSRDSPPAKVFLYAMIALCVGMSFGGIYRLVPEADQLANLLYKLHLTAILVALAFTINLALIFPAERIFRIRPPNTLGIVMIVIVALAMIGLGAGLESGPDGPTPTALASIIQNYGTIAAIAIATVVVLASTPRAGREATRSSRIFLLGLWIWAVTGTLYAAYIVESWSFLILSLGVSVSGMLFAAAIASGRMVIATPQAETMVSSSKSKYNLLRRNVYLVNEPKADFSFKMFTDVLKGRCYDCQDDHSFTCESIACDQCKLPCPCRECSKYESRSQGLIVTRRFPNEIRKTYLIQTTPILWLSTVAGAENMDPAKLSLLTDYLTNFMERSHNGVVLVDGIEYLVTSNDFARVLKAVDKWTESAMTSNVRLIISVDGRAFDPRDLAMLESSRNVVRPDARERWKVIPERI